jgi:uncharacterized membrane protein
LVAFRVVLLEMVGVALILTGVGLVSGAWAVLIGAGVAVLVKSFQIEWSAIEDEGGG